MIKNLLRVLFLACALSTGLAVGLDAGGGIQNSQFCRIELPSVNHSLVVRTTSAITTNNLEYAVQYCDFTTTTTAVSYSTNQGKDLTNTPDRTLLAAPAASTIRVVRGFTICNTDTASAEVQIDMSVSGTKYRLYTVTLASKATFSFPESLSGTSSSGVTSVTATSPITSTGGATPVISTSMSTSKLIGRTTAGSGVMEEISVGSGLTLSAGSLSASTGSVIPATNNFRCTLETGVPVSTTDQSNKTTIYITPYNGNYMATYDSSVWTLHTSSEFSVALGTITSGKNYDVFVYSSGGTLTGELSAAWASDTARTDAIAQQDGVWVKSSDHSRRLVATFRTTSTTQTQDTTSQRYLWNVSNRVDRRLYGVDTTDSWTYTTATWRATNANSTDGVGRFSYVVGLQEDTVKATRMGLVNNSGAPWAGVGIGIDSTSANSATMTCALVTISTVSAIPMAVYEGYPGLGFHYVQGLEISGATGTTTWYGDAGASGLPSSTAVLTGIMGTIKG